MASGVKRKILNFSQFLDYIEEDDFENLLKKGPETVY